MEYEDDKGIQRKKNKKIIPVKVFKRIKLISILLLPVFYFLYSPLLIIIAVLNFCLYFLARDIEKKTNSKIKKEYRITIPKYDSVLVFIAIIITVAGVLLSMTTTSMRGGMFTGQSDEKIAEMMEEKGLDDSDIEEMLERMENRDKGQSAILKQLINAGTMLTGETILFENYDNDMQRGGKMNSEDFTPPENSSPPENFSEGNGMDFAKNIPFSMLFKNIAKSVNTVIIFLVAVLGLITVKTTKEFD